MKIHHGRLTAGILILCSSFIGKTASAQSDNTRADSMLKNQAEEEILLDLYQQAARFTEEGALQNAISTYEILLQKSPDFLNAQAKLAAVRSRFEEEQKKQQLEAEYTIGVTALKQKNWPRAIIAFEKVLELDPKYRDTRKKLAQANRGLEEQSTESIASQFYSNGMAAMNRREYPAALAALEKVRHFYPNYRDTEALIAKIESELQPNITPATTLGNYYNTLYQGARQAIERADWMQAVLKLEKLRVLKPDDQEIVNLLAQARSNLKLAAASAAEKSLVAKYPPVVYLGGALAAVIVLPTLGLLFFSPTSRARFQFLRGNYLKAAQIYERLLSQHPERVKLYVTLANIYLLIGRDDERALRVYKMVLNFNLAAHMHPQIHSILMQKYLANGARDSEAIAALETALRTEQNKQSNS